MARLCPPHWPARPPARQLGLLAERDRQAGIEAAWLHARLIAADLAPLGISVVCAPVLDLALPGRTRAIGDRALGADPQLVAVLGQAMIDGFLEGGVLPVIKHLPGHGRARRDSHLCLPTVSATRGKMAGADWIPFRACRAAPFAMTAHVLYPALDPARPATMSPGIIETVIRGEIGFAGTLLSDDLSMGALRLAWARCAAARAAGCDLALHCNGDLAEMAEVLDAAGPLEGASARARNALARLRARGVRCGSRCRVSPPCSPRSSRRSRPEPWTWRPSRKRSRSGSCRSWWRSPSTRRRTAGWRSAAATTPRACSAGSASIRSGTSTRSGPCSCRACCCCSRRRSCSATPSRCRSTSAGCATPSAT